MAPTTRRTNQEATATESLDWYQLLGTVGNP
jgi:hypothetical protein